jgi:hypothetical protein
MAVGVSVWAKMLAKAMIWALTTDRVCPDSRCSRVSPTHTMGNKPAARAALVLSATKASVSAKYCRRSLWPMMTAVQPASLSMGALTSPVNAPVSLG